jgi:hypothetical protein
MHTHVEQDSHGHFSLDSEPLDASAKYFRGDVDRTPTVSAIAEYYRARAMAAVVFTVDATAALGHPALSSEEIAERPRSIPTCSSRTVAYGARERVNNDDCPGSEW